MVVMTAPKPNCKECKYYVALAPNIIVKGKQAKLCAWGDMPPYCHYKIKGV